MIGKEFAWFFVLKEKKYYPALGLNFDMLLPTKCRVAVATTADNVCNAGGKDHRG